MIQRIQSVFLVLIAVCMFSMIFLPLWGKMNPQTRQEVTMSATSLIYKENGMEKSSSGHIYLAMLAGVSATLAIGSLFSYKDRRKQMMLNMGNALVLMIICCTQIYICFYKGVPMFDVQMQGAFGVGFYMPLGSLILNSAANRFIRRDDKLVKSIDRLR